MATLQDEVTIKGMRLRNRIVLPPLTTNYGSPDGLVTDDIVQFYTNCSKDVGLTIVEATAVRADGRIVPGGLGLWEDEQISGTAKLVDSIKEQGAAAVVQINHAGARCVPTGGDLQGAAPSGFAFKPDVAPLTMNPSQIDQLVTDFAAAAGRAAAAGYEGVEIHGAHLYLISQFLSPLTNKRNDRYGGDAKGRATLAIEVVKAIREKLGKDYPIIFRLNAVEKVEGGQTLEDALLVSRLLADAGVDVLHVSLIAQSAWKEIDGKEYLAGSSALPKDQPSGANIPLTQMVKNETGLPVIVVGKLAVGKLMEDTVRDADIDMVAIGRQMIADPDTIGKILADKESEIARCEECMTCFATIGQGKPMGCKVNRSLPGSRKPDK